MVNVGDGGRLMRRHAGEADDLWESGCVSATREDQLGPGLQESTLQDGSNLSVVAAAGSGQCRDGAVCLLKGVV